MKKFLYCGVALLFACSPSENEDQNTNENEADALMSMGYEGGWNSKAAFDYIRFHNPNTGEIPADHKKTDAAFAEQFLMNTTRAEHAWDPRGPYNIGGRTRTIAIDVLDSDVWLTGGVTGGIWRSTDAGDSWTKVTAPNQLHSVTWIDQDERPGMENVWYAGTGELYGIVSASTFEARFSGDGIMKSTDNGLTWTELASTQSDTPDTYLENGDMDFIWKVVTDPSDLSNDVVLAAAFNGVFYSNDGGSTWSESLGFTLGSFSARDCNYLDIVVTSDGVFYVTFSSDGPSKGVYRSEDGLTWTTITPDTYPSGYGKITMAINPQNENEVWFFGNATTGFANDHMLYKYTYLTGDGSGTDGTWEDRSMNLPDEDCDITGFSSNLAALNTQSSFDVHVAVHPADEDVIYIAGTSIWRSTDGFTSTSNYTWVGGYGCWAGSYDDLNFQTSYPNHHPDQHVLMFHPDYDSIMINVNDGGVYVSYDNLQDSMQWVSKNNGYYTTQFYACAIEPGETTSDIIIGGMQDNNTWYTNSTDETDDWKRLSGGDGMYCAITEGEEFYLTCLQYGRLFLNEVDADGNVTAVERIDPEDGPSSYNWANSYKLDPNDTKMLYWNARNGIMRLDLDDVIIENDKTNKQVGGWVDVDNTTVNGSAGYISDIEMCKSAPGTVWYGSSNGDLFRTDLADTDSPVQTDLTWDDWPNGSYISSVAVNPYDPLKIVISFANYGVQSIWKTIDGGVTWEHISGNLEENEDGSGTGPAVLWMEYYPDGTLFAGTSIGLFSATGTDGASTVWEYESGIGNVVINHMDYRTYDGKFVVATHGQGVFSTNLPAAVTGELEVEKNPTKIYPTITRDNVFIESESFGTAQVFNVNGQLIQSVKINSELTTIDVSTFQAGTYLFVMDGQKTQKFVVR